VSAIQISVLASIIVVPLTAYYFGTCSPISVAANLLVVWVATPVVWLGMLVAPVGFLAPAVRIMFALALPLLSYLDWIISRLSGVAQFDVPAFSGYWLVLVFGLTLALWRPVVRQP
jgi:hypothetical protein